MPKFRSKPREIEAYQFLAGKQSDETMVYPQWLFTAITDGTIIIVDDLEGTIINNTHGSEINFKDTDWIIFNGPDDIYPCTDEEFQQRYERIE